MSGNQWRKHQNCMNIWWRKHTFTLQWCQYHALWCTHVWDILGCSDLWWCACELHWGRVEFAGSFPEESLQRCDAGDLLEPHGYRYDCEFSFAFQNSGKTCLLVSDGALLLQLRTRKTELNSVQWCENSQYLEFCLISNTISFIFLVLSFRLHLGKPSYWKTLSKFKKKWKVIFTWKLMQLCL